MARTTPRTWVSSETVSVALMNTHIRDNVKALLWRMSVQTDDLIKNSETTLEDMEGLSFRVKSGETWVFFAYIYFVSNSTADVQFTVTAPAGSTGRFGLTGYGSPVATASETTFGNAVDMAFSGNNDAAGIVSGKVVAGADGEIQIQAAQRISTAFDTTFQQGSAILAFREL